MSWFAYSIECALQPKRPNGGGIDGTRLTNASAAHGMFAQCSRRYAHRRKDRAPG